MMTERLPTISLLTLAKYMVSKVDGRAAIVGSTRKKNTAAALRYSRAREEVIAILRRDRALIDVGLVDATTEFRGRQAKGDWDASDLALSADAFDSLRGVMSDLDLGDRPPTHRKRWPRLIAEGVSISVAPDLIVRRQGKMPRVGAIKLRFGSTRAMDEEEGTYAAIILRYYLLTRLRGKTQRIAPRLCQIVDVSSGQVFVAPNAYKREIGKVRLACAEFRAQWLALELADSDAWRDRGRPPLSAS